MPSILTTDAIVGRSQAKVPSKYTTFTERWYLLLAALLLNFSYGSLSTLLLPLPNAALDVICSSSNFTSCSHLQFWFWTSYTIGFLLSVLPSTFLIVRLGILPSIYIAFVAGLLSVAIRFVGLFVNEFKVHLYLLIFISHAIHALTHPLGLIVSTTISQCWFASGQRTLASSLVITSYFLGLLSSFVLTPNIVDTVNTRKDLLNLTYVSFVLSALPFLFMVAVWRNKPLIAPSASADEALVSRRCKQQSLFTLSKFFDKLGTILAISATLMNCLIFGCCAGAVRFTMQLHNQILCLHGYLFKFSGLHALILMASTLTSLILAGITDSIYSHKQVYKVSFALITIASCILSWANSTDSKQVYVFISLIVLGFFGVGFYNVAIEMAIETSFPVHPAKITALMLSFASAAELVYIAVAVFARRGSKKSPYPIENCHSHGNLEDYSTSQVILTMILLVFFLLGLLCLKWTPGRKNHENSAENMRINNVLVANPLGSSELRTRC